MINILLNEVHFTWQDFVSTLNVVRLNTWNVLQGFHRGDIILDNLGLALLNFHEVARKVILTLNLLLL